MWLKADCAPPYPRPFFRLVVPTAALPRLGGVLWAPGRWASQGWPLSGAGLFLARPGISYWPGRQGLHSVGGAHVWVSERDLSFFWSKKRAQWERMAPPLASLWGRIPVFRIPVRSSRESSRESLLWGSL